MPSYSREKWRAERSVRLDELAGVHRRVGGTGRGRRFALRQVNHAYAVLLAAEFQGYCRDFHSECAGHFAGAVPNPAAANAIRLLLGQGRQLDRGNATPANIGSDFARLGVNFWSELQSFDPRTRADRAALDELNAWRNAIVHQDFNPARLGVIRFL